MKSICDFSQIKFRIFQYLAAACANLGMLSLGVHYGWASTSIPVLTSGNYSFKISDFEASWMIVIMPIGSLFGDLIAGGVLNTFGRKKTIVAASIPLTVSWILVASANSSEFLYVARFIAGFVDGVLFTAVPPYLAEISDPEIRGFLGTTYFVTLVLGMLLANVTLSLTTIPSSAYIAASVTLLMLLMFPVLPESPYFHAMKNEPLLAKASLQKLRGKGDVTEELARITKGVLEERALGKGDVSELVTNVHNRKCLLLSLLMTFVQQFTGSLAIQSYCETVFQETGDVLSPRLANIVYFAVYFAATLVALTLVDVAGRRPLMLASTGVACVTLFINAGFLYFKYANGTVGAAPWAAYVQIAALFAFTIAFSVGLNNVPVLVSSEIFPSNIKSKAFCVVNIGFSFASTGSIAFFSWANAKFGMWAPFFAYALCTSVGTVLIALYLPETKLKTLEEIQAEMKAGRKGGGGGGGNEGNGVV